MDYNGWSNYETWDMALNLNNDEYCYRACDHEAKLVARYRSEDPEEFRRLLAAQLEELGRSLAEEGALIDFTGDNPTDIEGVNWYEIAATYDVEDYMW